MEDADESTELWQEPTWLNCFLNKNGPTQASFIVYFLSFFSIRVVKAMQLGMTSSAASSNTEKLTPYVIVEIDEPGEILGNI